MTLKDIFHIGGGKYLVMMNELELYPIEVQEVIKRVDEKGWFDKLPLVYNTILTKNKLYNYAILKQGKISKIKPSEKCLLQIENKFERLNSPNLDNSEDTWLDIAGYLMNYCIALTLEEKNLTIENLLK